MLFGCAAGDGAILHGPVLGAPDPIGEVFAVEEGFETRFDFGGKERKC